jgi:hypothetical protein
MDLINWLLMNIEFEQFLLQRIKEKVGTFHQDYKRKLDQINSLIQTKNKQLLQLKK